MKIKCVDNAGVDRRSESLVVGKVYEIDPRRDVTFSAVRDGSEKCFWVNGKCYSASRFVVEG